MVSSAWVCAVCALCVGSSVAHAAGARGKISPVESVVNLIEKLQAQTQEEGKKEAAAYDKYACFCKEQSDDKLYSITKKGEKMALLSATIKSLTGEIVELGKDITRMNKENDDLNAKCEEEQTLRDTQQQDYVLLRTDLAEAEAGAAEAIELLKSKKMPGQGFLQLENAVLKIAKSHSQLPQSQQNSGALDSLLQLSEKIDEDPHGSEFHSDAIINMMMEFQKKFKLQKNEVDESENQQKHTFDMAQAARKNQIKALEASIEEAESEEGDKQNQKNLAEEDLVKTTSDRNADDAFMQDLTAQCEEKAKVWDQRSQTRSSELTALSKALAVIKGEVSGNYGANKKLVLEQQQKAGDEVQDIMDSEAGMSLLQKRRAGRKHTRAQDRALAQQVLSFLKKRAAALKSKTLEALMVQMKEDHFVKVRTMIKDMVAKLEADASAEADQKGWCDEEMKNSMDQRDENIALIEGDTALSTKSEATIMQLQEEITALLKEIADLKQGLNEATQLRATERADNAKTVEDTTAGLAGVTQALKILNEFYEGAFVQYVPPNAGADGQTVGDMAPDTGFDEDYHGNQDAASGILGMLAVIKSDFERSIEQTNKDDSDAEDEFNSYKSETETAISEKEALVETKKGEQKENKGILADSNDDLGSHKKLKAQALQALAKLKPACVDTGADYAEKVARREQEIESLKSAYVILDEMR